MKTVAYLRVSTIEQNTEKNKADILKFANDKRLGNVDFVEETISGKSNYKDRQLGKLLSNLKTGDTLIVPELSRLARSITQILEIIEACKSRKIVLYSLKENFSTNDECVQSKITSTIFALVAEIERELISKRTKEALQVKKMQGVVLGRPTGKGKSKLDNYKDEILALLSTGVAKTKVADKYNISRQGLDKWLAVSGDVHK